MKANVEYLGKYIKRPPIGETRIKLYDGKTVTFEYLDHYTNIKETMALPVLDFIERLLCHIPDKHFRNIRYYGFLSNRLKGKLLPSVYKLLHVKNGITTKVYLSPRKVRLLETKNTGDLVPVKEECDMCHIGFTIPVNYTDNHGKTYPHFHEDRSFP